jgi:hypothetical protein
MIQYKKTSRMLDFISGVRAFVVFYDGCWEAALLRGAKKEKS